MMQQILPIPGLEASPKPFKKQLLKWIGNKQRFAHKIATYFPAHRTYYEPFLGSGAVLGTLAPEKAVGSDVFKPLADIWRTLKSNPDELKSWYASRVNRLQQQPKELVYEDIKASFNAAQNGPDLLYLCRACYGGVVRFRKADGFMSTPCGVHQPVTANSFSDRVDIWHQRCKHTEFLHADYKEAMALPKKGDLVYCDPPYVDTQTILYGAQEFSVECLFNVIEQCKRRGVLVALSIDGTKRSGNRICDVPLPDGLFESEVAVNCGRSMLRRFQLAGQTLEHEVVSDRLLLTYSP